MKYSNRACHNKILISEKSLWLHCVERLQKGKMKTVSYLPKLGYLVLY